MISWRSRVEFLMVEHGVRSKAALASLAGLHPSVVARALKSDGDPQLSTLQKIADALEVQLGDIFATGDKHSNLPPDLAAALGRLREPRHLKGLRTMLESWGLLDEVERRAHGSGE
jgi:transcriptional regulator with XRE-family HTH domain